MKNTFRAYLRQENRDFLEVETIYVDLKLPVISNPDILIRITSGTWWLKPEVKKCLRIFLNIIRERK